jgi:hypothetical protein
MINWKNLEKFIAPGKVVTLVLLVDGEEVGAFSFNVDSLAFKEALEAASHLDPVKVAEKKSEPAKSTKKSEPAKKAEKPEPEPMDEEEPEEEDVDSDGVPAEPEHNDIDKVFVPETKPMTREQIMAQMDKVSTELEKPVEQKNMEEKAQLKLTDEW